MTIDKRDPLIMWLRTDSGEELTIDVRVPTNVVGKDLLLMCGDRPMMWGRTDCSCGEGLSIDIGGLNDNMGKG